MDSQFNLLDRYWRAANYLTVGQIYLLANPLLREPLTADHVKPRLLGHWGTSPGLSFVYAHLNRLIRERDANVIYIAGPGHGGPALVANVYLEGTYSEVYPDITENEDGMLHLFRQFSTPGGIPSHVSAPTPGSIHEGGELGYALGARVRGRVRQPRPHRGVRDRRRRSRDGSARGLVEGRALPPPQPRRRGAADPPPQRLQDQRTDGARPHRRRRRGRLAPRPRVRPRRRCGRRPGDDARAVRRRARHSAHADPRDPVDALHNAASLARHHPAHAERLDRPRCGGRRAGRRHVPGTPSAARERARQRRAPRDARRVDAQLRARRPLRREGSAWSAS